MWTAQKKGGVGGKYADPTMKLAALPSPIASSTALHTLEAEGKHAMETTCKDLPAGGTIVPRLDTCYNLQFAQDMWQSLFKVDASSVSAIAFFAQHFPTEFEETAHYFKDHEGTDVEPVAQEPAPVEAAAAATTDDDKPWGEVVGASVIVNLMTLVGVIFLVPAIRKFAVENAAQVNCVVSGFAAGALIACAFFLLLFEATHLVATGWKKEVEILWRWGTAILGGYMLPGFVDNLCAMAMSSKAAQDMVQPPPPANKGDTEAGPIAAVEEVEVVTKARLIAGVVIGDFFHNFCDGIFMGAAFKGCGSSFGWGVALSTVLHEIPQEISDYVILTGPNVGLGPFVALLYNFLSGLSVTVGGLIVLASEFDDSATGLLLAFGGGVYLEIAATECMPKTYAKGLSPKTRIAGTVAFVIGAILIGLVLLDHEHCVPPLPPGVVKGSADDPHAGHHH
jgi:zinc transporter ZupT